MTIFELASLLYILIIEELIAVKIAFDNNIFELNNVKVILSVSTVHVALFNLRISNVKVRPQNQNQNDRNFSP